MEEPKLDKAMVEAWIVQYEPSEKNRICKCVVNTICVYHSGTQIARAFLAMIETNNGQMSESEKE